MLVDEATASCDSTTDKAIQEAIAKVFGGCTVLTIAHRIHTIADSDRILVMDAGKVVDFDAPQRLLAAEDSIYSRLLRESAAVGGNKAQALVTAVE